MPLVEQTITAAGLTVRDIECFACGTGPGSFTGLRVGISTAQGLALGTDASLIGVPTMDVLSRAVPHPGHAVCTLLDAGRGEVYAAVYRAPRAEPHRRAAGCHLEKTMPETILTPEELISKLRATMIFTGSGLTRYSTIIRRQLGKKARILPASYWAPRGAVVAELAREKMLRGSRSQLGDLKPLYIRRTDAEIKWEKKKSPSAR